MGKILDGKKMSAEIFADIQSRCALLLKRGVVPGLATVLVGDDPASQVYVGQKIKKCQENGLKSFHRPLPSALTQKDLMATVNDLNNNPNVHGIIVQLPLPKQLDAEAAINALSPQKDADGLHPYNQGLVGRMKSWKDIQASGVPLPCTPAGIIYMLQRESIPTAGKVAVVVGRSTLVGKPVAQLLLSLDATVTVAHSQTPNLLQLTRTADILVAALGREEAINKDGVKEGAVVVDVGITRTENGLKGDVDFNSVLPISSWITPVPGGGGSHDGRYAFTEYSPGS